MQPGCVGMGERVGGTRMASEIEAGDGGAKGGGGGAKRAKRRVPGTVEKIFFRLFFVTMARKDTWF